MAYGLLIALVFVVAFDPLLLLGIACVAVPMIWLTVVFTPRIRRRSVANRVAHSGLTSRLQETFSALKIIKASHAENLVLQQELIAETARFPPHMMPRIRFLEGKDPIDIMLVLTTIYAIGLVLIGTRTEGHNAETFRGSDPASNAENELSEGWASAGGLIGLVDYWINVRLSQRLGNTLRTQLFARLTHSAMTTIDEQRVGDSLFRVMYDSVIAWA